MLNPLQIPGNVSSDETESQLEERILESGSAPTETAVSFIYNDSWCLFGLDPCHAKLTNLNFYPLEAHEADPQLHVAENYTDLFNSTPNICKS